MDQRNGGIPFLPGFQLPNLDKENFRTSQTFKVAGTTMLEKKTFTDVNKVDQELVSTLKLCTNSALFNSKKLSNTATALTGLADLQRATDCLQTGYQFTNPEVLRFFAYFTEPVFNSQIETKIVRKVKILFYLEDDTLQINEERVRDCGIPQGDFLKRQKVYANPLKPLEFIGPDDLCIGQTIKIFQREFTIYSADEGTCRYLGERERNNQAQGMPVPIDEFSRHMYKKSMKVNNPETKFFKEYVAAKNGGGNPNKGLEQYIANDRKVLSFQALWNDTSFAGDLNQYTINYFLADDTVEVKELQVQNSGKHPFPLLLKKAKLPKKMIMVHCPGMTHSKIEYYTHKDFILGRMINIFGRDCLLFDCDQFTKNYYQEELGWSQVPVPVETKTQAGVVPRIDPPYNGFGSEQDSLGNCRLLIPKPPKKDMIKLFKYDSIILRFICERITGENNDKFTSLILNFYMGDDSLSIYLNTKRNSGILSGKFLERKKYKNKARGDETFSASDFYVGAVLDINNHLMRIISADEFTINYMTSHPETYPLFSVGELRKKLRNSKTKSGKNCLEEIGAKFKNDTGFVDFTDLMKRVKNLGVDFSAQEFFAVFVKCDRNEEGQVCLKQVAEVLNSEIN